MKLRTEHIKRMIREEINKYKREDMEKKALAIHMALGDGYNDEEVAKAKSRFYKMKDEQLMKWIKDHRHVLPADYVQPEGYKFSFVGEGV